MNFTKRLDRIFEAMDRRGFLKTAGRTAAATALPTGALGKVASLVGGKAAAPSAPIDEWTYEQALFGLANGEGPESALGESGITAADLQSYLTGLAKTDPDKFLTWATADDPFNIDQAVGGGFGKIVNALVSKWTPKELFSHVSSVYGNTIGDNTLCALSNYASFSPSLAKLMPPQLLQRARDVPELAADLYRRYGNMDDASIADYVKKERSRNTPTPSPAPAPVQAGPKTTDLDRWADDGGRVLEAKLRKRLAAL